MFKKIVLSLLCVASMVFGVANAENVVNPYELANSVASKVIDDIKANKDRLADKKVALSIINNDLMPYVDVKYAAYKVIGTSLKRLLLYTCKRTLLVYYQNILISKSFLQKYKRLMLILS